MTLNMTTAQVVEKSVDNNSPIQDYVQTFHEKKKQTKENKIRKRTLSSK